MEPTSATRSAATTAPPVPPLPPPSAQTPDPKVAVCALLKPLLAVNGWSVKVTNAMVVQAQCQETVSFSSLNTYLETCKTLSKEKGIAVDPMVTTIGKSMVVCTRVGAKRQRGDDNAASTHGIEDKRDKIRATLAKLSKSEAAPPKAELDRATKVLDATVCQLLAVGGCEERAVQSYGIFLKKLAQSDPRNRIVLALRLHAGTPVRIQDMKLCFGECWTDGAVTSAETVHGVDSVALPLTDEGALSLQHGNAPLLVVTSVTPSGTQSR